MAIVLEVTMCVCGVVVGGGGHIGDTGLTESGRVWRKVLEMMLWVECGFIL